MKQFDGVFQIFQPETVFKWHRELVRRKWTFVRHKAGGRPPTAQEVERLVIRLAREYQSWGNGKIQGELAKLGYVISDETVGDILRKHGIPPMRLDSVHLAGAT